MRKASSALQENAAFTHIDWAPFLTCCTTRCLVHISVLWGDPSPRAQWAPQQGSSTCASGSSQQSVNNICIHSSYSLSMKTLASAPKVIARFIQIQREQENRLLRAPRHHSLLMGQWHIQLWGWLQMLTIKPVTNEREMIAEIPQ